MPRTEYDDMVEYRNSAGELHRDGDLPAKERNDGGKQWYINGKRHRIDHHAWTWSDGDKWWFLNGVVYYSISDYYSHLYLYKGIIFNL